MIPRRYLQCELAPSALPATESRCFPYAACGLGSGEQAINSKAVRGIDLDVAKGEVVGIVGESGSGKSVAMLAALGLTSKAAAVTGSVRFNGDSNPVGKSSRDMRKIRGARIAMIFQDPLSSLNPVMTVGAQIAEAIRLHQRLTRKQAMMRTVELLNLVAIPQPERRINQYPHEFSGGCASEP